MHLPCFLGALKSMLKSIHRLQCHFWVYFRKNHWVRNSVEIEVSGPVSDPQNHPGLVPVKITTPKNRPPQECRLNRIGAILSDPTPYWSHRPTLTPRNSLESILGALASMSAAVSQLPIDFGDQTLELTRFHGFQSQTTPASSRYGSRLDSTSRSGAQPGGPAAASRGYTLARNYSREFSVKFPNEINPGFFSDYSWEFYPRNPG